MNETHNLCFIPWQLATHHELDGLARLHTQPIGVADDPHRVEPFLRRVADLRTAVDSTPNDKTQHDKPRDLCYGQWRPPDVVCDQETGLFGHVSDRVTERSFYAQGPASSRSPRRRARSRTGTDWPPRGHSGSGKNANSHGGIYDRSHVSGGRESEYQSRCEKVVHRPAIHHDSPCRNLCDFRRSFDGGRRTPHPSIDADLCAGATATASTAGS